MARAATAFFTTKNELKISGPGSAHRNHTNDLNSGAVSVKDH